MVQDLPGEQLNPPAETRENFVESGIAHLPSFQWTAICIFQNQGFEPLK